MIRRCWSEDRVTDLTIQDIVVSRISSFIFSSAGLEGLEEDVVEEDWLRRLLDEPLALGLLVGCMRVYVKL